MFAEQYKCIKDCMCLLVDSDQLADSIVLAIVSQCLDVQPMLPDVVAMSGGYHVNSAMLHMRVIIAHSRYGRRELHNEVRNNRLYPVC